MSNVWFCSDLHFGHKGIGRFRENVGDDAGNRANISMDWLGVVHKKDVVYVLGDAAFTEEALYDIDILPGTKYLVRGNHDVLPTSTYLNVFKEVYGLLKYKEFWLSHAPIHPDELRHKVNLHGHVHYATIKKERSGVYPPHTPVEMVDDGRYFNCCPENLWKQMGRALISLDEIRK